MSSSQGILFLRNENEEFKWFEHGDKDKDGKYVGEYKNGKEWNGTYYDNNGKKEYKLVNGEIE